MTPSSHRPDSAVNQQARQDLADYFGVKGNKFEPKLWALAWEYGHADGLSKVFYHYTEFVVLVKDDEE